jgi:hypothetical protein
MSDKHLGYYNRDHDNPVWRYFLFDVEVLLARSSPSRAVRTLSLL